MSSLPSVTDVRAGLPAILQRFRAGNTRAFSFGDTEPEAVVLTYDEFEDLGGETTFAVPDEVLDPATVAERLPQLMRELRSGRPVVWGAEGEPEAVVLSTTAYRDLRGDDQPPPGVADDPTQRTYATEPQPTSQAFDLDEWAADDPFTQDVLRDVRAERRAPGDER